VREILEDDRECYAARTIADEVTALDHLLDRIFEAVREHPENQADLFNQETKP
jgi:hypothetical protein